MNNEINSLCLPRGRWQALIQQSIPIATKVVCDYPDDRSVLIKLFKTEQLIATFTLSFLYGCKGILVSHSMQVSPEYRGQGIAKKLQPIKQKIATDLRVSVLIATVRDDNSAEKNVIKDWDQLESFDNVRTGNKIDIFMKRV